MPGYQSPGVYVEEVSSASRPIEGVATSVAAFVGFAEQHPVQAATAVLGVVAVVVAAVRVARSALLALS